jgi:hypothetical protein
MYARDPQRGLLFVSHDAPLPSLGRLSGVDPLCGRRRFRILSGAEMLLINRVEMRAGSRAAGGGGRKRILLTRGSTLAARLRRCLSASRARRSAVRSPLLRSANSAIGGHAGAAAGVGAVVGPRGQLVLEDPLGAAVEEPGAGRPGREGRRGAWAAGRRFEGAVG